MNIIAQINYEQQTFFFVVRFWYGLDLFVLCGDGKRW